VAGDDERDLVFARAFEWSVIAGRHPLDDVERIVARVACDFDEGHAASTVPMRVEMRTPQGPDRKPAAI